MIARTDLTKDSTLKDFVSNNICLLFNNSAFFLTKGAILLEVVNDANSKGVLMRRLDTNGRRDLNALDYIFNEHPNKEQIFGAGSDWTLPIQEEGYKKF